MNTDSIQEGCKNYIKMMEGNPDPEIEKLSKSRLEICISSKCIFYNAFLTFCRSCTCDLEFKTRSTQEKCPEKLW